jgi:hypothetical protein
VPRGRRNRRDLSAAPAPAPQVEPSDLTNGLFELQRVAGNQATMRVLHEVGGTRIARTPDTAVLDAPATPQATSTYISSLDDPDFNADTRAHDLTRAIDQSDYTYAMGQKELERRNVDAAKVIAALSDLTPTQVAEVERRYASFTKGKLRDDLFAGGHSDRQSSLKPDQRARIDVLMKGTRPEPLPESLVEELKRYPPAIAMKIRASLHEKASAAAKAEQLKADAIELHELMSSGLNDARRERVMALHRRKEITDIDAIDAYFDQHFGPGKMAYHLHLRLKGLQLMRMSQLRLGNTAQADACAIEDKRRQIEKLNKQDEADKDAPSGFAASSAMQQFRQRERQKKREALTGDITAIVELNKREVLDDENETRSPGVAIAERLNKILQQQAGEVGNTLGSQLRSTLGKEHAASIDALVDAWNVSGSWSLVESAAAELAAMEKAKTTNAAWLQATLRSFRELAQRDIQARVLDPTVSPSEKEAIGQDPQSALTRLAQSYIEGFADRYKRYQGEGRSYQDIVKSADSADETLIGDLSVGGGQTSPLGELQHAMGKKNVDKVKEILKKQPNREAINALIAAYNNLGSGRDLRKELFGTNPAGEASVELAELDNPIMGFKRGMVTKRTATQVAELLSKPGKAELAGEVTVGADGLPKQAMQQEIDWIAAGGEREFQVTMEHRGLTGRAREIGDNPETQDLLDASRERLKDLRRQWLEAKTPRDKQHLLLEMVKTRKTLTGDADAYEEDNARVLGEIQSALGFAVSIALAIAIPGAGPGLMAFIKTTALNIAANVATNVVIKAGDYGWKDLKGDVLGGLMSAGGAKFGEELLGRVAMKIAPRTASATVGATERYGIHTALSKEASAMAEAGEKAVIDAAEFEARQAGSEAANAVSTGADAAAGTAAAGTKAATMSTLEKGARELGSLSGGMYGQKVVTGDYKLTIDELWKTLFVTWVGKAAAARKERLEAEAAGKRKPDSDESTTRDTDETESTRSEEESTTRTTESEDGAGGLRIGDTTPTPTPDALGPRSPTDMLAANGIPAESARGFQEFADQYNLVVKVRPTNTASLPVLAKGGVPKAEIIKAKTLNRVDMLIGGPLGQEGKVGFFKPKLPSADVLDVLTPQAREAIQKRFDERSTEFAALEQEYNALAAEGLVRIQDGVLQIADPRSLRTADAPRGKFRDVGGDHDVFDIRHADGTPLTDAERAYAVHVLRSLGINVEHGFHTAWKKDSPSTYSPKADARIIEQHTAAEALVAFAPKQDPREVFADTVITTPTRKPRNADPHMPLKGAQVTEPGTKPPEGAPGTGVEGEVQIPGETDFRDLSPGPDSGPSRGAPGHGRASKPRTGPPVAGASTTLQDVLPDMFASGRPVDRHTAEVLSPPDPLIVVTYFEDLPLHPSGDAATLAKAGDPATQEVRVHPELGDLLVGKGDLGMELSSTEILVRRNVPRDQFMQTLRHEVNHLMRGANPEARGSSEWALEHYKSEFDAAWADGQFAEITNLGKRAEAIHDHILEQYVELHEPMRKDAKLAGQMQNYKLPEGNTLNSMTWSVMEFEARSGQDGWQQRALDGLRGTPAADRQTLSQSLLFQQFLKRVFKAPELAEAHRILKGSGSP